MNYWAPWCGPCRAEIPELNDLAAQAQGFEVLGVHFDDAQGELLLSDMRQLQVRFPVLLSDPALTWGQARPAVLPSTWLVDGQRTVRKVLTGPQTAEAIASALREQGVLE
ncbi:TlpA family protein disulfide reductase [Pseudomonas sp. A3.4]|nr:TlpA family protein disulfide reductase [Atopomonas sediminilitoris]